MSPLNERLRTVAGAKMLVDVVQIGAAVGVNQLRKAVHFVCGNTLVCESIKDAKSVAFDGPERHKVTFHGTNPPAGSHSGVFVSRRPCPWTGRCSPSQG